MVDHSQKRDFPLEVVQVPGGWSVVVYLRNNQEWSLMKPGWHDERHTPYVFKTSDEAWAFLRRLFQFCLQQHRTLYKKADRIMNCDQCGRVFRARYFRNCSECLQQNEFMLQQIWQGFYYMSGTQQGALEKMALLLDMPLEQVQQIPVAFGSMVRKNLEWHLEVERQLAEKNRQEAVEVKDTPRMHYRRAH